MKFSEVVNDSGLSEEINRICSTTNAVYSNKAKVARINAALDRYFSLAFKASSDWQFDDSNNSTPPIQTINLVSGQRRYELDDFTSEILNLCRVEILDSGGNDFLLTPISLSEITVPYDDYDESNGTPQEYTKIGKFIDLHPAPNYAYTNGLKIFFDRPPARYEFATITASTDDTLTASAVHNLVLNDTVIFETDGTIPTGLTADTTNYFVISGGLTTTVFKVSTTKGGTAVDITDAQASSNHTFLETSKEPGVPSIHHNYLARYASLPFLIENKLAQKNDIAALIQQDERDIIEFFSRREKDTRRIMTMRRRNYR